MINRLNIRQLSSNLASGAHDPRRGCVQQHVQRLYLLPSMAAPTALQRLDPLEVQILQKKGAFSLPPKTIQDELIDLFFTWVAPILPVIQKADFMRRYRDPLNPPSLLLLQAVFISVSRFASQRIPGDGEGTESKIFFGRAKALYDAGYERDPVTVVQSLVLMSWYWHGAQGSIWTLCLGNC